MQLVTRKFWSLPLPSVSLTPEAIMASIKPIQGWGTKDDYEHLYRHANMVRPYEYILELGSHIGKSAAVFLMGDCNNIILVDVWDGWVNSRGTFIDTFAECKQNVGFNNRIVMIQGATSDLCTLQAVQEKTKNKQYGFLYVDGDHTYHGVCNDIRNYVLPLVPVGRFVAFHDYARDYPEIIQAINELLLSDDKWQIVAWSGRVITLQRLA